MSVGSERKLNSIVPGLSIVGISWGALTAGLMLTSKSTRNMLNAKYALRADSKITSHPISWLTSAALHASPIHFLANSICGWSIARDMRTVDAVEMFLLGCLWCGCLQTFWGLLRPTMAIGSSGMWYRIRFQAYCSKLNTNFRWNMWTLRICNISKLGRQ